MFLQTFNLNFHKINEFTEEFLVKVVKRIEFRKRIAKSQLFRKVIKSCLGIQLFS